MPYQTTIGRITTVEFLAAFPPGFFLFVALYVCMTSGSPGAASSDLWTHLNSLSADITKSPPLFLFVTFAAYLLGSITRSMPVQWAERLVSLGRSGFPFENKLRMMLDDIKRECKIGNFDPQHAPLVDERISPSTFNYWKDFLCARAPESFSYYQSFEARSRFYTGMFWAGAVGVLCALCAILPAHFRDDPSNSGLGLGAVSLLLCLAFGTQLRRVREQEARVLLTLYIIVATSDTPRSKTST